MNSLQPFSATHPYMASPGNHEAYGTQGGGAFQQFARRYQAITENAAANSASNNNFFYSFDTPLVHWIAFTVESWTMTPAQLAAGAAWIAADVAKIDRSVTPWVVAFSHKAWQMDQTTWSLFDWMTPAGVDFHFVGHCASLHFAHELAKLPPACSHWAPVPVRYRKQGTSTRATRPLTRAETRSSATSRACRPTTRRTPTPSTRRSS